MSSEIPSIMACREFKNNYIYFKIHTTSQIEKIKYVTFRLKSIIRYCIYLNREKISSTI